MSANIRPLKRARVEDSDRSGSTSNSPTISLRPKELKRHEELWFDDGNLVLVARVTAFRIYRGLIASQSTVFSDMLVSSCASADETFDGCPTVQLSDSPEDLAHFLRVLLPGSQKRFYCREACFAHSFDEVSAVIRLAHKYHVADIQDQALLFLQDYYFPSKFNLYEERRKAHTIPRTYGIAAVNIAGLTNTPSLLPVAFLECHSLHEAIFNGHTREDGTVEHLSADDLRRCFVAQYALPKRYFLAMTTIFRLIPSAGCRDPERCERGLNDSCSFIIRMEIAFLPDCIVNWAKVIRLATEVTSHICPECEKDLQARDATERRKFWEDLPKIFGITVEG